jgi:hypothetical protein
MVTCQSSEGCKNAATHWVLVEYSWPALPIETRTHLLCKHHMDRAKKSTSNQMSKYPETGIRIIEQGTIQSS